MSEVCGVEQGVQCPQLEGFWPHFCTFDEGHEECHECGCGHVWTEGGDE